MYFVIFVNRCPTSHQIHIVGFKYPLSFRTLSIASKRHANNQTLLHLPDNPNQGEKRAKAERPKSKNAQRNDVNMSTSRIGWCKLDASGYYDKCQKKTPNHELISSLSSRLLPRPPAVATELPLTRSGASPLSLLLRPRAEVPAAASALLCLLRMGIFLL